MPASLPDIRKEEEQFPCQNRWNVFRTGRVDGEVGLGIKGRSNFEYFRSKKERGKGGNKQDRQDRQDRQDSQEILINLVSIPSYSAYLAYLTYPPNKKPAAFSFFEHGRADFELMR